MLGAELGMPNVGASIGGMLGGGVETMMDSKPSSKFGGGTSYAGNPAT